MLLRVGRIGERASGVGLDWVAGLSAVRVGRGSVPGIGREREAGQEQADGAEDGQPDVNGIEGILAAARGGEGEVDTQESAEEPERHGDGDEHGRLSFSRPAVEGVPAAAN